MFKRKSKNNGQVKYLKCSLNMNKTHKNMTKVSKRKKMYVFRAMNRTYKQLKYLVYIFNINT